MYSGSRVVVAVLRVAGAISACASKGCDGGTQSACGHPGDSRKGDFFVEIVAPAGEIGNLLGAPRRRGLPLRIARRLRQIDPCSV
jgi:hypothetical protein